MKNKNFKSIKTFSDACIAVGTTEDLFYQKYGYLSNYLLNVGKLEIINKAINGEWIPNWGDLNEYKYYPYFTMSVSSGFGFSDSGCGFIVSGSAVGSRLCYETKEQALYAGEKFVDAYKCVYIIEDNEPPLKELYSNENKTDLVIKDSIVKNFDYKSIKTYEDACKKLGISTAEPNFFECVPELRKSNIAIYKLMIVFKAINNGWIPNWGDLNEYKYYSWKKFVSSGFGFSDSGYGYRISDSNVSSRLCTYNKDVALYIGEQFNDLYLDWVCLEDEKKINFITITLDDMEKIHSIACEKWKNKIIKLTNEHKDENPFINKVYLPKQIVDEMINACTQEQLPIVKKIFGK